MNLLFPKIPLAQLRLMLGLVLVGALVAGGYGILHDQITYTIGPEYFTNLKFRQFAWANLGMPPRVFAGEIGFLATWWVGAITAWALARITVPAWPRDLAVRLTLAGFAVVFVFALVAGAIGYLLGLPLDADSDFSNWDGFIAMYRITDPVGFVRVAYIHNASYLGGGVGLLVAVACLLWKRPRRKKPAGA